MNVNSFLLIILGVSVFIHGCNKKKNPQDTLPHRTTITGVVKNGEHQSGIKEITLFLKDFDGKAKKIVGPIDSKGNFRLEFDQYIAQDVRISPIAGRIIVHPGDKMKIELDFKNKSHVKFQGDSKETNEHIYKYLKNSSSIYFKESSNEDFITYKLICDSIKQTETDKLDKFIAEEQPSNEFIKWNENNIAIKYYQAIFEYWRKQYNQNKNDFHIDSLQFNNMLEDLESVLSSSVINSECWKLLNFTSFKFNTNDSGRESTGSKMEMFLFNHQKQKIPEDFHFIRQYRLGSFLVRGFRYNEISIFEDNKFLIESVLQEEFIKKRVEDGYKELKTDLNNAEFKSGNLYSKTIGTEAHEIINSIIQKNKGRVIYIDFWATWCGPCKNEMKYVPQLKSKFTPYNVAFVYACIDSKNDAWKLTVPEIQVKGQHLFCNKAQSKALRKAFDIKGVPFYMLIDKNGNITETGSHLRPSGKIVERKIKALI